VNTTRAAREELVLSVIPLTMRMARHIARHGAVMDRDDLFSEGMLGAIHAAERWDPDAGVPFIGYAARRIRGAMIDALRRADWRPTSQYLAGNATKSLVSLEAADDVGAFDALADPHIHVDTDVADQVTVQALLDQLPTRDRFVIEAYYFNGWLAREIGDLLDVTESRVIQILRSIRTRLAAALTEAAR